MFCTDTFTGGGPAPFLPLPGGGFTGPPLVVFDEEHNGLRDNPGIASLARKYRLHGVIAGLILLAGLFVWKKAHLDPATS